MPLFFHWSVAWLRCNLKPAMRYRNMKKVTLNACIVSQSRAGCLTDALIKLPLVVINAAKCKACILMMIRRNIFTLDLKCLKLVPAMFKAADKQNLFWIFCTSSKLNLSKFLKVSAKPKNVCIFPDYTLLKSFLLK